MLSPVRDPLSNKVLCSYGLPLCLLFIHLLFMCFISLYFFRDVTRSEGKSKSFRGSRHLLRPRKSGVFDRVDFEEFRFF